MCERGYTRALGIDFTEKSHAYLMHLIGSGQVFVYNNGLFSYKKNEVNNDGFSIDSGEPPEQS